MTTTGKLRPSQAVTQNGPGALIDLPTLSMVVLSADRWELSRTRRVDEPRLARRLRVSTFRTPPYHQDDIGGLPAALFPGFLVCPRCHLLDRAEKFTFNIKAKEFTCPAPGCPGKGKASVHPARFMVACPKGHLSDFPWHHYVHPGVSCSSSLHLEDSGATGSIADLWVTCDQHGSKKNLGQAFGREAGRHLPGCDGSRPWLGDVDPEPCDQRSRVLLRGASNAYFPVIESAISIPPWSDPVQVALGPYFDQLAKVDTREKLDGWFEYNNAPELEQFGADRVWQALHRRREGLQYEVLDLRAEEWRAFQGGPVKIDSRAQFQSRAVDVPADFDQWVAGVMIIDRLREVRAQRGFTRIDPIPDVGQLEDVEAVTVGMCKVSKAPMDWLPGVEFRGEGIFLRLHEARVKEWERKVADTGEAPAFRTAQEGWHAARGMADTQVKPLRYALLHTLSHLVIRQLGLDCGYASASLRERIYCSDQPGAQMAGVLIYTATSDSQGSLGGLVEMGRTEELGPLLTRALDGARLCACDPHCSRRGFAGPDNALNGAACHACLMISETACEASNRLLSRGFCVSTLSGGATAYFDR
jgi:hypothetical protein